MKLLFDENLSWRLVKPLSEFFPDSIHTINCKLNHPAKDVEIWDYAKKFEFTIVTNDEDFLNLLMMKGFPPKIILFRTGNQSTTFFLQKLISHHEELIEFEHQNIYGLIEIF